MVTLANPIVEGYFASPRPSYNEFIPSADEGLDMFMQLLPKGRAYSTHDLTLPREESVIKQFWYAIATQMVDFERKAVDLLDDGFCSYVKNDLDGWRGDYLQPDEEAIYADSICAKANQAGVVSVEEYRRIAEAVGWVVNDIRFLRGDDPIYPNQWSTLFIQADFSSPIIRLPTTLGFDFVLGSSFLGGANIDQGVALLAGLFDRIMRAHVNTIVEVGGVGGSAPPGYSYLYIDDEIIILGGQPLMIADP